MFDISAAEIAALWQVLIIDLVLAGDSDHVEDREVVPHFTASGRAL